MPPTSPTRAGRRLVALIALAARGDERAFARVYDETAHRALAVAHRVLRDPDQAEEVVQEAYLTLWRQSGRFDPAHDAPVGWILATVRAEAADRSSPQGGAGAGVTPPSEAAGLSEVRRAYATLTPPQREALCLACDGGLSTTEVAGLLGLAPGTVTAQIRSGLRRLRDELRVLRTP